VKRDAAAVALFGTKAEDLGDALFAMDPSFAAESLGQVTGAAQEMSDTLSSNTKTSLEAYKRQALMGIANILVNNVVPAVLQVIAIFQAIAGYINENREYFLVLAGAILAVLVPSLWAWVTAQWALVAAQIASAAAFIAANAAIILIIAAIAAMVAGVIYAYKHWGWFKTAVDAVVDAFKVAVAWIGDHVIPVIADIVTVVGQVISTLWNLSQTAWDVIQKVVGFFGGLSSGIANVIGGVTEALLSPFRSAFNAIANLWNNTVGRISFNVPGWVPGIGGKGFDVPDIPTFADGGLAFSPMLAIVGDHKTGGAEIITPEDKMRQIFREEGGTGINIGTVNVTNGDWGSMNKEIDFQWRVNRGRGAA
jgi:phage-related protein